MPNIKIITFDLDDTLWDMRPVLLNAEQEVYRWLQQHCPVLSNKYTPESLRGRKYDIAVTRPELRHQLTQLRIYVLSHLLQENGYVADEAEALSRAAFDVFIAARHKVSLFDGTTELLASLASNYKLGALTNGNADVNRIGLGDYFSFAFTSEDLNASKPDKDHFVAAEQLCATPPTEMIHIGDHPRKDVQAAMDNGWHSIWFNPKKTPWRGRGQPSAIVSALADIGPSIAAIEEGLS